MASASPSLLPKLASDFNTKDYWKRFNEGTGSFEWYGNFRQLESIVRRYVAVGASTLVIGCGNSTFSVDLYESGITSDIVNIDFDENVVSTMQKLYGDRAPSMRWEAMDMRDLTGLADSSFDVVIDKGAFDALMSSAEEDFSVDASSMMRSVSRVLKQGGYYVCVSLMQSFVYEHLSTAMSAYYVSIDTHILREAAGMSSLVPFLLAMCKGEADSVLANMNTWFDSHGRPMNESKFVTLEKFRYLLEEAQSSFQMDKTKEKLSRLDPGYIETIELWTTDTAQRKFAENQCLGSRRSDRGSAGDGEDKNEGNNECCNINAHANVVLNEDLGSSNNLEFQLKESGKKASAEYSPGSKYTLTIIDVASEIRGGKSQAVVAFIVPQGREHEYLFSTHDGLKQIANSADCCRLISITLNRGYSFESFEVVQSELSQTILDFAPNCPIINQSKIPFVTTEDSIGNRNIIARGFLNNASSNNEYIVEECNVDGALLRRLVFMENSNVIQTEVRLVERSLCGLTLVDENNNYTDIVGEDYPSFVGEKTSKRKSGKKSSKKGRGKKANNRKEKKGNKRYDKKCDVRDSLEAIEANVEMIVDYTYLCFDYHRAILAGMAFVSHLLEPTGRSSGVIIGLGGGALPMILHHFFPVTSFTVCELDDAVLDVAKKWFGFCEKPFIDRLEAIKSLCDTGGGAAECDVMERVETSGGLQVTIGDGLLINLGEGWHSVIIIDVDSKDTTVGMSCPPAAFVALEFLQKARRALVQGGVLVLNVAARSQAMYESTLDAVCGVFTCPKNSGSVFTLKSSEDDINTVIFAIKGPPPVNVLPGIDDVNKQMRQLRSLGTIDLRPEIKRWLARVPRQDNDPLGLLEIALDIKTPALVTQAQAVGACSLEDKPPSPPAK